MKLTASISKQGGRRYGSFNGGTAAWLRSIGTGSSVVSVSSTDLTTLLVPHLAALRASLNTDQDTAWAQDIPVVRAAQNDSAHDLNTDYFEYLQSHV